ncbi:MAG: methyltransferase [Myxococcota bacterium]
MAPRAIEDEVRAQYEQYPYPLRSPGDDAKWLADDLSPLEGLRFVSHFGFAGRLPDRPMRILVAGGGTGDATVQFASQLSGMPHGGEVVHLDLSQASIEVAQQRVARIEQATPIRWHRGSLLEADPNELGTFDYINCSGVLHHLPDPWAGVEALKRVLAPHGVMGIMVYGPYGRHGLYPTQELLRRLTQAYSTEDRIAIARRILPQLPKRHPLQNNAIVGYVDSVPDSELVDRFLHPCDRAFSVPEAVAWMKDGGLRIVDFVPSIRYAAALLVADPWVLRELSRMSMFDRYAVAELWSFHLDRHSFFAVRSDNPTTPLMPSPSVVPSVVHATDLAGMLSKEKAFRCSVANVQFRVPLPPTTLHLRILEAIDGRRNLQTLASDLEVSWDRFFDVFLDLYTPLHQAGFMVLSPSEA